MGKHQRTATVGILAIALPLVLSACSGGPPRVIYPDGSSTVPANNPERIEALKSARAYSRGILAENDLLRAQVVTMQKQLDDLRIAITSVLAVSGPRANALSPTPPIATPHSEPGERLGPQAPAGPGTLQHLAPRSAIDVVPMPRHVATFGRDASRAKLYTRTFATNETRFTLDAAGVEGLVQLATNAANIEIHGATDSYVADGPNQRVAYGRAHHARQLLVNAGVDAAKIRTRVFPAGHFVIPNDTAYGRAQNRRVHIFFFEKTSDAGQGV
jgi:flagellar motor protein MotB